MNKILFSLLSFILLVSAVNAQKIPKKKPAYKPSSSYGSKPSSSYGSKPNSSYSSGKKGKNGKNNTGYGGNSNSGYGTGNTSGYSTSDTSKKPSSYGGGGNGNTASQDVEIVNADGSITYQGLPCYKPGDHNCPLASGGLNDSIKVSKRSEDAVERNLVKDRAPLSYTHLREDDAVYKQRIWREIDTREKMNLAFRYAVNEDNGNQRFISILINAIKGGVTAFDGADDRFTTPLTLDQAMSQFGSKVDHTPVQKLDDPTVIDHYCRTTNTVNLDLVTRYRIKEEVVFDKNTSRLYTRILGIAPMMPHVLSDGTTAGDGQLNTLFWLYYPDLRPALAKYDCYNPKNFGARMSWEDLFESRMFSSYITKSTMDNPFDQYLKEKYAKNPLFVLLEGEAIKDKMFNYEQDLWSY